MTREDLLGLEFDWFVVDDLKDKTLSIENTIKISENFNNIVVIKKEYLDNYNR